MTTGRKTLRLKSQDLSASDQFLSKPISDEASSTTVRVHRPLGFSPLKAARASSGTRGVAVTRLLKTASVTGIRAESFHSVPLKVSSEPPPLSLVRSDTVPAGEVKNTSRSALNVWVMVVV